MQITSHYKKTIFWRVFKHHDTVYIVGLEEGTIASGGTGSTKKLQPGDIVKLEIKEEGLFGKILQPASTGFLFSDMAAVDVDEEGNLTYSGGVTHENWARAVVYYWIGNSELGRTYTASFSPTDGSPPGGQISWRRYSVLPPFYTYGDHDMSQPFTAVMTMPFTEVWFNFPPNVVITWTPQLEIQDIPPPAPLPGPAPDPS